MRTEPEKSQATRTTGDGSAVCTGDGKNGVAVGVDDDVGVDDGASISLNNNIN